MKNTKAKLSIILSMVIFGTIGIFRRYIPLPSALLACTRGIIGSLVILASIFLSGKRIAVDAVKKNLVMLCLSGAFIGINWILLFEAYRYTTVATATLCYYMAPIFIIIASPVVLRERLTVKKLACIVVALFGMVLVSGILNTGFSGLSELTGILLGLGAALFYATVILMNKRIHDIPAADKTMIQLASAAIVVLPYTVFAENLSEVVFTPISVVMLIFVGIVHTGFAYVLYFGSLDSLKAQTAALFSYIDPVVAIILSAAVLREKVGIAEIIGAILVLGSTMVSELCDSKQ